MDTPISQVNRDDLLKIIADNIKICDTQTCDNEHYYKIYLEVGRLSEPNIEIPYNQNINYKNLTDELLNQGYNSEKLGKFFKCNNKYYQIIKNMGEGAFGQVYKVIDVDSGKLLAAKYVDDGDDDLFGLGDEDYLSEESQVDNLKPIEKEARAYQRLQENNMNNIVKYYGFCDNYLIIDLLPSDSIQIDKLENIDENFAKKIKEELYNIIYNAAKVGVYNSDPNTANFNYSPSEDKFYLIDWDAPVNPTDDQISKFIETLYGLLPSVFRSIESKAGKKYPKFEVKDIEWQKLKANISDLSRQLGFSKYFPIDQTISDLQYITNVQKRYEEILELIDILKQELSNPKISKVIEALVN